MVSTALTIAKNALSIHFVSIVRFNARESGLNSAFEPLEFLKLSPEKS